ncbi:MAG: winged helix-turn-helix transcriptional regulator [Candidatus Latescibacterota bacterium]|nr:MAG: winged helix-turn-helix transcriptional regulator [Candidatus Latescibacterota bacterium]
MSDDELKQKILDYLLNLEGKGVVTTTDIGKAVGVKRKECSRLLRALEEEGKVASAGVMAGVAGYKAVK